MNYVLVSYPQKPSIIKNALIHSSPHTCTNHFHNYTTIYIYSVIMMMMMMMMIINDDDDDINIVTNNFYQNLPTYYRP